MTLAERLWARVDKSAPNGCWNWTGCISEHGYGLIGVRQPRKRTLRTHRLSWTLHHGSEPQGLVLHRCDNPLCCNPDHLFLGSQADNIADMIAKGRAAWAKRATCKYGHPLVAGNLLKPQPTRPNSRDCRECHKRRIKETRQRKKGANNG